MPSDTDIIIALAKKLQAQTARDLEAENATLRRERDDARAQGISDLNRIHRQSAAIKRLEEERDQLRAGQGTWPDDDDFPCCSGGQLPRVIDPADLRSGASVATFTNRWMPVAGIVTGEATEKVTLRLRNDDLISLDTDREFVLLTDAPEPEQEPKPKRKRPYSASFWAFDLSRGDLPDGEVVKNTDAVPMMPTPAPRLTVHALNTAPVGSVVTDEYGNQYTKTEDGDWSSFTGYHVNSDIMQWPEATLHHPKRGDHE